MLRPRLRGESVYSRQDFDFEEDCEYDGGSFDSRFAGNARSSPMWKGAADT